MTSPEPNAAGLHTPLRYARRLARQRLLARREYVYRDGDLTLLDDGPVVTGEELEAEVQRILAEPPPPPPAPPTPADKLAALGLSKEELRELLNDPA